MFCVTVGLRGIAVGYDVYHDAEHLFYSVESLAEAETVPCVNVIASEHGTRLQGLDRHDLYIYIIYM